MEKASYQKLLVHGVSLSNCSVCGVHDVKVKPGNFDGEHEMKHNIIRGGVSHLIAETHTVLSSLTTSASVIVQSYNPVKEA